MSTVQLAHPSLQGSLCTLLASLTTFPYLNKQCYFRINIVLCLMYLVFFTSSLTCNSCGITIQFISLTVQPRALKEKVYFSFRLQPAQVKYIFSFLLKNAEDSEYHQRIAIPMSDNKISFLPCQEKTYDKQWTATS